MSFLTRTSTTTLRTLRLTPRAAFSTSLRIQKSAVDPIKDAVKAVDRTVSDAAVKGIEKGQAAAAATRETVGINTSKASGAASETAGSAKGTASHAARQAQGAASETASNVSGKASELAGEAKGKASEVAGKAKGSVAEMKGEVKGQVNEKL